MGRPFCGKGKERKARGKVSEAEGLRGSCTCRVLLIAVKITVECALLIVNHVPLQHLAAVFASLTNTTIPVLRFYRTCLLYCKRIEIVGFHHHRELREECKKNSLRSLRSLW